MEEGKQVKNRIIRVDMVFEEENGFTLQFLSGKDAENWLERVNGVATIAAVHGYELPEFPWTKKILNWNRFDEKELEK